MRTFDGYKKGVNLGGWISQCVSYEKEHFETFITEDDIKTISQWGLDHVRLPIDYDIIADDDGEFIPYGIELIDRCISWCEKYNLNIILDLHKTKGYMFDCHVVHSALLFFDDDNLQRYFIDLWTKLAKKYGNRPANISFELLNEITDPCISDKWNLIAKRTISAIRKYAPDTHIVVGGTRYNAAISIPELDEPYDDLIVYNFHCYEPFLFTHQAAHWVDYMPADFKAGWPDTIESYKEKVKQFDLNLMGAILDIDCQKVGPELFELVFESALKTAEERNVPLYCGEYGVIDKAQSPDILAWFKDINSVFEKHGISRAAWNYKDKDFGLSDEEVYKNILPELVKYL